MTRTGLQGIQHEVKCDLGTNVLTATKKMVANG
jgi:hypothetical protein